jgi:hypothetical protein
MKNTSLIILTIGLVLFAGIFIFMKNRNLKTTGGVTEGETKMLVDTSSEDTTDSQEEQGKDVDIQSTKSTREIFVTEQLTLPVRNVGPRENVKHSIPINEILGGGPRKDGIRSIDTPKFISTEDVGDFLNDESPGLGLYYQNEARFYPYSILVQHELVNDVVAGDPLLISYCPLCLTGVVFDRRVGGDTFEFGVSGMLWQSNLLMYNRTGNTKTESLWSQVLGEAVLGDLTGTKLRIIPADAVRFGDWKKAHADTVVLSRDTGLFRDYSKDPYGDYYTSEYVSFGASFSDTRLHPKAFVLGIEIDGKFKAYHSEALKEGVTRDSFVGRDISIEKSSNGEVRMFTGPDKEPLPYIGGFWFSWIAVHPDTELLK